MIYIASVEHLVKQAIGIVTNLSTEIPNGKELLRFMSVRYLSFPPFPYSADVQIVS
jgi:hypothetical protein